MRGPGSGASMNRQQCKLLAHCRLGRLLLCALLLAALGSCAGGSKGSASGPQAGDGSNAGFTHVDMNNLPQEPAGEINLGLAALIPVSAQAAPDKVKYSLTVSDATQLYQLSCRIAFDPLALRPVHAERGSLVDSRAVFFAPLDRPQSAGYVPLAFTYHSGEAMPAASGEIAALEFEVLDPGRAPGIRLLTDPQYLIARNSLGQPLTVNLEVLP